VVTVGGRLLSLGGDDWVVGRLLFSGGYCRQWLLSSVVIVVGGYCRQWLLSSAVIVVRRPVVYSLSWLLLGKID